jgi:hypothetical protein
MSNFDRAGIEGMRLHESWRIKTVNQNAPAPAEVKRSFGFARDSELVERRNQRVQENEDERAPGFAPATLRAVDVLPFARLRMQSGTSLVSRPAGTGRPPAIGAPLAEWLDTIPAAIDRLSLLHLGGGAAAALAGFVLVVAMWPDALPPSEAGAPVAAEPASAAPVVAEAPAAPAPAPAPASGPVDKAASLPEVETQLAAALPALAAAPVDEAGEEGSVAPTQTRTPSVVAGQQHLQAPPTPLSVTDYARPPQPATSSIPSPGRTPSSGQALQPGAVVDRAVRAGRGAAAAAGAAPVTTDSAQALEPPPAPEAAIPPARPAPADSRGPSGRPLLRVTPEARPPLPPALANLEIPPFLPHDPPVLKPLAVAAVASAPLPSLKPPSQSIQRAAPSPRDSRPVSPIVRFFRFLNGTGG